MSADVVTRRGCRAVLVVAVLSSLALAGCTNLQAVREFAKTSAATADYRQIVADYVTSPERQKRFQPDNKAPQLDALSKERAEQQPRIEAAQAVLADYMTVLGDLADDELPVADTEIDTLVAALGESGFVGKGDKAAGIETATAAGAIAKVVARAVLDQWRQRQVRSIIKETDKSVQSLVAGLREVVLVDFGTSLDIEAETIQKYFEKPIAEAASHNDTEALPPLARSMLFDRLDRIGARRAQLKAYAGVLDEIGKGHSDLIANVDRLNGKELTALLKQRAKEIQALYKAILQLHS